METLRPSRSLVFSLPVRHGKRDSSPVVGTPRRNVWEPSRGAALPFFELNKSLWPALCAFLLLLLLWRHAPQVSRGHFLLPLPAEKGAKDAGESSREDPYVEKKFPREGICERSRYPSGDSLRADKVTILVNGFAESRIKLLQDNMWAYAQSPLVDAIYVLWGNISSPKSTVEDDSGWKPEEDESGTLSVTSSQTADGGPHHQQQQQQGVAPIRVIRQRTESLNDRFLPRDFIRTRAVIICDDDITVDLGVLAFALRVWGENQRRIAGFFPRAHQYSLERKAWLYTKLPDRFSIVLTKFMILHADYLYEYTCGAPPGVKEYVDVGQNCEDVAMNFLVSAHTKLGPVLVAGSPRDWGDTRNSVRDLSAVGLSARKGHKEDRGTCIAEFQRLWGGMELRYSYSKASPDVSEQVLCDKFGYMVHCDHKAGSLVQAQRAIGLHLVRKEMRYAYVTLVASADLLAPAVAFAQSLRLTGTPHDVVLMVDESAGAEVDPRDPLLLEHFDRVRRVPTVHNRYNVKGFSKLNAWLMEEYDKVVYIDVDTLVLANLDHLFERPEPAAVPDVYMSERFNSGLLVLRPSRATHDDMMRKLDVLQSYNKGDQGFLNAYFSGWFHMPPAHRLPARYNAVIFFPEHYHPPAWFDVNKIHEVIGPVAMVHFANPWFKPWKLEGARNLTLSFIGLHHRTGSRHAAHNAGVQADTAVSGAGRIHEGEEGEAAGGATQSGGAASQGGGAMQGSSAAAAAAAANMWCSLWLRLACELDANGWHPLPPHGFSLAALLPNAAEYKHLPAGPALPTPLADQSEVAAVLVPDPSLLSPVEFVALRSQEGSGPHGPHWGVHDPVVPLEPAHIGREAFVTVVTRKNYFAAPVWATSYLQHHTFNSWRKTVLLVLSSIPKDKWRPYRRLFNYVKVVEPIVVDGRQLDDSFAVLHAWDQKGFQKLVYVDPVALFTDNCNELLNFHPFAAAPAVFPPDTFSSRVMVIRPNATTYADLLHKLKMLEYPPDSLDRFLNAYYHDWFRSPSPHRIPPSFGVDMWFKEGLMKFFVPWKILVFDPRAAPWSDISDWMAHDRTKAVKLWRRTFCSLEDAMRPPDLEYMCKDLAG